MDARHAIAVCIAVASLAAAAQASARSMAASPGSQEPSIVTFTTGGGVIELADGSVWAVSSADQTTVTGWSVGDTIDEDVAGADLTDLDTGDIVDARKIGETDRGHRYPHLGRHAIGSIGGNGTVIVLTDRSVWAITATKNAEVVNAWSFGAMVTIKATAGRGYQMRLTNPRQGSYTREGRVAITAYYIGNT